MAGTITTLYIDDTNIRLMETRGKRISKLADAPLDINLTEVTTEAREAEIVAKIKQLFKANKVKAKKVIIGLSGMHCLSRPVVLPQLPRAMLDEAVIREAKRVLPVPLEQLYLSWQILSASEGKMQAFMVAIPCQIADSLLRIMHQVGLKPYLMDIKPLALARLVKEEKAIVVDVQAKEFDIVIVSKGIPQPIRTVPFPEEALSLPDKVVLVKDELYRTIQFFNSNNPDNTINADIPMFVSGEMADEPELNDSLANEMGRRVLPLVSPLKCPKQLDPSHYLVNIGLVLKELPKEAGPLVPNLNTIPTPYQPKPLSLVRIIALPAVAVAIGSVVLLGMVIQDTAASIDLTRDQLNATNFLLTQKQSQKKDLAESIAALEKELAGAQAAQRVFTAALSHIDEKGEVINGDLEATVNNVVYGMELRSINHSGDMLSIAGLATSEVPVLSYARRLDASGRFSEVTIANIRQIVAGSEDSEIEGEEVEGEEDEGEETEGEETEGEEAEGEGEETGDEDVGDGTVEFNLVLRLEETE